MPNYTKPSIVVFRRHCHCVASIYYRCGELVG